MKKVIIKKKFDLHDEGTVLYLFYEGTEYAIWKPNGAMFGYSPKVIESELAKGNVTIQ